MAFYSSKKWKRCRNEYSKSAQHLCERCLRRGIVKPGEIVHHKIEITPENISDPSITLSYDNLELLCRDCHAEVHKPGIKARRFSIGKNGEVIIDGIL